MRGACLGALALTTVACFDPIPSRVLSGYPLQTITGEVKDTCSLRPVAGAKVDAASPRWNPRSTRADAAGHFALQLEPDLWSLRASQPSHLPYELTAFLTSDDPLRVELLLSSGRPPASLRVTMDLLLVIDRQQALQEHLVTAFPAFTRMLRKNIDYQSVEGGNAILDLRIGVIGAGAGCRTTDGERGRLVSGCAEPPAAFFDVIETGKNSEDAADRLDCQLGLVKSGCSIWQPLEAAKNALNPALNPDFLRPDSVLLVVIITHHDDCSYADPPSDVFGCFEKGISCDEWTNVPGVHHGCTASEKSLVELGQYVSTLTQRPPERRFLAVIAGAPGPVTVTGPKNLSLGSTCSSAVRATPGIRLYELIRHLGPNGSFQSVCGDLTETLERLAGRVVNATVHRHCSP